MLAWEELTQINAEMAKRKGHLSTALRLFHRARDSGQSVESQVELFSECVSKGVELFDYVESAIALSELKGATRNEFWGKDLANTAGSALDYILTYYAKELWPEADRLKLRRLKPSPNAFSAMQNVVLVYNPDQAKDLLRKFRDLGLPVRGFTHPANMNQMALWEKITTWGTIIGFLVSFLLIAAIKTNYPPEAFFIFRVILALIGAAFGAVAIPGFLAVTLKVKKSIAIRATGAVALFVLIFYVNPPQLVAGQKSQPSKIIR